MSESQDPIAQAFMDALQRLQQNAPKHPELAGLAARDGLRINVSNVALEAGHSRTLIGHVRCKYPKIRARILAAKKPIPGSSTALSTIQSLRQQIQELRDQIKRNDTINATLLVRARESERREQALERRLARLRKEDPSCANVTPFRRH